MRIFNSKREILIVAIILLIAFAIRFMPYSNEGFSDTDAYVHYSIVEQALSKGTLPTFNSLDNCPAGMSISHPIGFYLLPMILGMIVGLKLAFALCSVLSGVLTVFLVYLLFRKIFNQKVAAYGSLFLAICYGHVIRSHALFFRGENFIIPLLLLSLLFGIKFLTENRKLLYSSLAALFSALAVLFWPGYPYAIMLYIFSVMLFLVYEFLTSKEIKTNLKYAIVSFILQFIFVKIASKFSLAPEHIFSIKYYLPFVLLPSIFLLASLLIFDIYSKNNTKPRVIFIGIISLIAIIFLLLNKELIVQFMGGFGFITPDNSLYQNISELQPITISILFKQLWAILTFSLVGLLIMLLRPDSKKFFLLGAIIPSIYLLSTTIRFIFFGIVLVIPLIGIFFGFLHDKNKRTTIIICGILFLIVSINATYSTNQIGTLPSYDIVQSLNYFGENTDNSSCLITIPDWGGMTQYYAKRASYTSSINQNMFTKVNEFFLTNNSLDFGINNGYIGLMSNDFLKLPAFIQISRKEGLFTDYLIRTEKTNDNGVMKNTYASLNHNNYVAYQKDNASTPKLDIKAAKLESGKEIFIKTIFVEFNNTVVKIIDNNATDDGCMYFNSKVILYTNNKLCNTNIIKMFAEQPVEGLKLWYSKDNTRIYKII